MLEVNTNPNNNNLYSIHRKENTETIEADTGSSTGDTLNNKSPHEL